MKEIISEVTSPMIKVILPKLATFHLVVIWSFTRLCTQNWEIAVYIHCYSYWHLPRAKIQNWLKSATARLILPNLITVDLVMMLFHSLVHGRLTDCSLHLDSEKRKVWPIDLCAKLPYWPILAKMSFFTSCLYRNIIFLHESGPTRQKISSMQVLTTWDSTYC